MDFSDKFNEMSNNLRQSYEQLEEKVLERTAELNASLNLIRKDLVDCTKIQNTTLTSNNRARRIGGNRSSLCCYVRSWRRFLLC